MTPTVSDVEGLAFRKASMDKAETFLYDPIMNEVFS